MKGLLLKDWYMLLLRFRIVLPFCLLFLAMGVFGSGSQYLFLIYPALILSVLPFSLFAYDERDRWLGFCGALPVSRGQYVSAKYLITPIVHGLLLLLTAAAELIVGLVRGELAFQVLPQMAAACLLFMLMPSILMPLILRFGSEKGRIIYYILIAVTTAIVFALGPRYAMEADGPASLPLPLLTVAAVVIYAGSWLLSVWLYQRRGLK